MLNLFSPLEDCEGAQTADNSEVYRVLCTYIYCTSIAGRLTHDNDMKGVCKHKIISNVSRDEAGA